MQAQKFQVARRRLVRPMVAVIAAAASCGAWAEEGDPYYIGLSQSFAHDSNVYRTSTGGGDDYYSTALLGGFDQPFGRQRVYATANVQYNKYRDQTPLDNTGYAVRAGWDWSTIEKLSGNFYVNANQILATFDGNASQQTSTRNMLKADQAGASVRWGGDGILTLEGAYAHSRVRYSAPESLTSQSSANSGSVGTYYRPGADTKLGLALRVTRTVSPYAVPLIATPAGPDDYASNTEDGRNVDLTVDWRATAKTGVNARLSWTRKTNSAIVARDFSGLSGALAATYAPTAKLSVNASASHEPGAYGSFFNANGSAPGSTVTGLRENSQTTDSYALGVVYAATAKISFNAGYRYSHAKILELQAVGGATSSSEYSDNYKIASLGANYAMTRNWLFACSLARESRDLTGGTSVPYVAKSASCSAQFTLR
jgi:hypothetical protein